MRDGENVRHPSFVLLRAKTITTDKEQMRKLDEEISFIQNRFQISAQMLKHLLHTRHTLRNVDTLFYERAPH